MTAATGAIATSKCFAALRISGIRADWNVKLLGIDVKCSIDVYNLAPMAKDFIQLPNALKSNFNYVRINREFC